MPERNFTVSAYGTPTVSFTQSDNRYRNPREYISILDRGAKITGEEKPNSNPLKAHGYDNFNPTSETNNNGWVIDKQFKPQPQYNAPMTPMAIQRDDNTQWIMSAKTDNYSAPIK